MESSQDTHGSSIEFVPWPKTPRFFKDNMVITEKIDGTNSAVGVAEGWVHGPDALREGRHTTVWAEVDGKPYTVYAQSRNRLIYPAGRLAGQAGTDNYGFAAWVYANHHELARVLGPGLHFGEWWGQGIGRGYQANGRTFSLFNTSRWRHLADWEARNAIKPPDQLRVVPVLRVSTVDTPAIRETLEWLGQEGSQAMPGYMNPEGICVYLPSVNRTAKVTFDDEHKGLKAA